MKLQIAQTQADFFGLMKVRNDVFVVEQHVSPLEELDTYDKDAVHFVAIEEDTVIGTCRLIIHDKEAKLGRMAVLKKHRRKGVASALIHFVEQHQKQYHFTRIRLGAQLTAIPFYESLGFVAYGDVFLDANIEHRMMEKFYE